MKILVVDDSPAMRNIVINSIKRNCHKPVDFLEAGDGLEALELLIKNKINLACLDWNMPRLDGLDFIKKVRGLEAYKKTPLLMITSKAAKYMVIEAVKAGATDYIVKPIVGEKLWAKVKPYF